MKTKPEKKIMFKVNRKPSKAQLEELEESKIYLHYKTIKKDYDYGLPHLMD